VCLSYPPASSSSSRSLWTACMPTCQWFGSWMPRVHAPLPGRLALGCLRGGPSFFRYAIAGAQLRYQGHAARHRGSSFGRCRGQRSTPDPANGSGGRISWRHPDDDRGLHHILDPAPGVEGFYFASVLPAFQSRRRWERHLQCGSSTASRLSISRRCLACASKTSRGPRLNCRGMRLGNIGTFTAQFELPDSEVMISAAAAVSSG
jgi:hypothetical protein